MKYGWSFICWIGLLFCCSDPKIEQPEEAALNLQMATEGINRFEDYIHSLNIYAFRKKADNSYVYYRTLAELDAAGVAGLTDASTQGDAKLFDAELAVGTYEIYFVGNAAGRLSGDLVEDVTTPRELTIQGNPGGQDSVYFLGKLLTTIVSDQRPLDQIILNRVASKLVLVVYGVPVEIDSVSLSLGNLASQFNIAGNFGGEAKTVTKTFPVRKVETAQKDTIIGEVVTLPSLTDGSPLQLTFYAGNGQKKVKIMPIQNLLPNKYLRVAAIINDNSDGLLNFEVNLKLFLFDYWLEQTLPDFILNNIK